MTAVSTTLDPLHREHLHMTRSDLPLKYVRLREGMIEYHESGPVDAPVLIFVHGALANDRLWVQVVLMLHASYRCIVPVWPLGAHRLPMNATANLSPAGVIRLWSPTTPALRKRPML
jgi:hypothetical protein